MRFKLQVYNYISVVKAVIKDCVRYVPTTFFIFIFSVILQYALEKDGVVISNDQYRDWLRERPEFRNIIENR